MSEGDLQPFRLPVPDAAPGLPAAPGSTGDDRPDDEGTPPEPGRPLTRALAWAGLGLAAVAVLGGLWLPIAVGVLPCIGLLIAAANRRRWDDFRTQTVVRTAMGLVVVAFAATMGGFLYRDQRDAIREVAVLDLREGQCLVRLPTDIDEIKASVRRCGLEHRYYVADTLTWDASPRPDNDVLDARTRQSCTDHLHSAYPRLWADQDALKSLILETFAPVDQAWTAGPRVTVCIISRRDGNPLDKPTADEIDSATRHDSALAR